MNTNSNRSVTSEVSIDELLATQAQQSVRQMVKAMPEDLPSLAWRSALNAKLNEQTARARTRKRIWWVASPSIGFVATAALCFAVFAPHSAPVLPGKSLVVTSTPAPSLEDQLVASHSDTATSQDVVGAGLSVGEVQQNSDDPDAQDAPTS